METWDFEPFDDDLVADWGADLHEATPAERPVLLREAFTAVLEDSEPVEFEIADQAIAAAAIVASRLPGGEPLTLPYAPDFHGVDLGAELPGLALRALTRVTADDSEWREFWEDTDSYDKALAVLDSIRAVLKGAS